jgi:hypothetical protein
MEMEGDDSNDSSGSSCFDYDVMDKGDYEILTPPVVSVTSSVSKTTEFEWKLKKLPAYPGHSKAITFQTGELIDDAVL